GENSPPWGRVRPKLATRRMWLARPPISSGSRLLTNQRRRSRDQDVHSLAIASPVASPFSVILLEGARHVFDKLERALIRWLHFYFLSTACGFRRARLAPKSRMHQGASLQARPGEGSARVFADVKSAMLVVPPQDQYYDREHIRDMCSRLSYRRDGSQGNP